MTDTPTLRPGRVSAAVNVCAFFASNVMSFGAMWGQRVVVGWLVWQLTASPMWLAAASVVELASALFLAPLAGLWLDRYDRRLVLLLSQGAAMLLSSALAVTAAVDALTPPILIALMAALGCAGAVYLPARLAFLMNVEGMPDSPRANSLLALASQFGTFAVPTIVGVVLAMYGAAAAFAVVAGLNALATLSMFAVSVVGTERHRTDMPPASVNWTTALQFIAADASGLRRFLIVFLIVVVAGRGVTDLFAGYVDVVFKEDAVLLSQLIAATGCGALLSTVMLLASGHRTTDRQLCLSVFLAMAGAVGLALARDTTLAILAAGVLGAGLSLNTTTTQCHLLDHAPPALKGRLSAMFAAIWRGGPILGVTIMATVSHWVAIDAIAMVAAALLVMALIVSLRSQHTHRLPPSP
jgi:MFS family permease